MLMNSNVLGHSSLVTRHSKIVKNYGILAPLSADNGVTRGYAWIST